MSIAIYPRAFATVTGPTATFVSLDGRSEAIHATDTEDIRQAIVRRATHEAWRAGAPVVLVTSGDRGEHHLLVGADGALSPIDASVEAAADATTPAGSSVESPRRREVREQAPQPVTVDAPSASAAEPSTRPTFLSPLDPKTPVFVGWRGMMARFGLPMWSFESERRRAECVEVVSTHWAGCRTIAVANGKGGVGKTMMTAMLAAVFAREGGGNVLAWDNNDTRGTLGWRTEQGLYDTTLRDLLPAAPELLAAASGVSDITRFVHHQTTDRYDVLRSNPELLATDQRIATAEFDLLMQVAARFYRLVVFDSGNDESAERWLRMVDSSYQLVIPTLAAPESAESAVLLLDALRKRDERSAALADNAVVIVTQSEPSAGAAAVRMARRFEGHVRAVEVIPFDTALKSGPLRFDSLRRRTKDAWLRAAASVSRGL